jgi:hypothetical protein
MSVAPNRVKCRHTKLTISVPTAAMATPGRRRSPESAGDEALPVRDRGRPVGRTGGCRNPTEIISQMGDSP